VGQQFAPGQEKKRESEAKKAEGKVAGHLGKALGRAKTKSSFMRSPGTTRKKWIWSTKGSKGRGEMRYTQVRRECKRSEQQGGGASKAVKGTVQGKCLGVGVVIC